MGAEKSPAPDSSETLEVAAAVAELSALTARTGRETPDVMT